MLDRGQAVAIVGAGSVGTIFAAHLAHAGRGVVLVENGPRLDRLRTEGVRIGGLVELAPRSITIAGAIEELATTPMPLAACLLCTKTWSLRSILPALQRALAPEAIVVFCQNGIGPDQEALRFFPAERMGRMVVNFAGSPSADGSAVTMSWFNPPNYLGGVDGNPPRLEKLAAELTEAGLHTEHVPNRELRRLEFFKTILNSSLNALCAICGVTMRQAMTYDHTRLLVRQLIREGLSVAAALGFFYGNDAEQDCLRYLDAGGDHLPSTWHDLQQGCQTEIEFINGKIVELGLRNRQPKVELNRILTLLILTHEIRTGARDPADVPDCLAGVCPTSACQAQGEPHAEESRPG